jgi:tartrate dehydrogenase/decarboxylase/D-malate dehydrogenase
MIWSGAMMLDFLGHGQGKYREAHDAILHAIEKALGAGQTTPDLGGKLSTTEAGKAIAAAL